MKDQSKGMLMILVTVVLWSTIEVSSKMVHQDIPAMMVSFLRFTIGGIVLLPVCISGLIKGNARKATLSDWSSLVLLSALGITLTFALYHKALIWITASSVATLISMVPIFAAPVGFFFLKERINWVQITGLVIGSMGIMFIYLSEEPHSRSLMGFSIMLIAVVSFSIYAVLMKRLNQKMSARVTTPLTLLIGGLLTMPIAFMEGDTIIKSPDLTGYLVIAWLGIFAVGLAYLLYFFGMEKIKVAKGNSLLYLKPVIAGSLAWMILGEAMTLARIVSILFISLSIYFVIQDEKVLKKVVDEE